MVPRAASTSFGVDPSVGPEDEKYSTPLMLRWMARCTSAWIRSGIEARSSPAGAIIFALRMAIVAVVPAGACYAAAVAPRRGHLTGHPLRRSSDPAWP